MKVLIACEESQVVTIAFRERRHEAYSCDVIACSGGHPEWHIQGDVLTYLDDGWDMMIAHPPCTRLANSGVMWLEKRNLWDDLKVGARLFTDLLNCDIEKIVVENPIPHKYALELIGRKYDQIIQPYMFGHPEQKATCLWIKGLPLLLETDNVKEEMLKLPDSKRQRNHWLGSGKSRERSKTLPGIAKAMAEQWG